MTDTPKLPSGLLDLLVLEGCLSITAVDDIREKLRASHRPLGRILAERGVLTMDQVWRLLEIQSYEPQLRIGELAVREGLCSVQDVEEGLRVQRQTSPHPLEVVLAAIPGDRERLLKVLVRYIRQLEARIADSPLPV